MILFSPLSRYFWKGEIEEGIEVSLVSEVWAKEVLIGEHVTSEPFPRMRLETSDEDRDVTQQRLLTCGRP